MKFKIGDKVIPTKEALKKYTHWFKPGETYDVYGHWGDSQPLLQTPFGPGGFTDEDFESSDYVFSELDLLVKKVNEGKDALKEIHKKYSGKTRYNGLRKGNGPITGNEIGNSGRVDIDEHLEVIPEPPKPKFESFYIGPMKSDGNGDRKPSWLVKFEDDVLHISCKKFNPGRLKYSLQDLVKGDNGTHKIIDDIGYIELKGNRHGIWTNYGSITWEDADKILGALQEAGVE